MELCRRVQPVLSRLTSRRAVIPGSNPRFWSSSVITASAGRLEDHTEPFHVMCKQTPMSLAATNPIRDEHLLPDRKHRLLACGLCRQIAPLVYEPALLRVLEVTEAFADGLVTAIELGRARHSAIQIARSHAAFPTQAKFALAVAGAASVVTPSSLNLYKTIDPVTTDLISRSLSSILELLADDGINSHRVPGYGAVFDDVEPRSVICCPAWRTDTAVQLARQMYEGGEFGAMPILADALQDAGCDNDDMLNHCRGPGPHVRGCWVIDLVLGKE